MAKHVPVPAATVAQPPRVIHYPDPAAQGAVQLYTVEELEAKRDYDRLLYLRWLDRQAEFADRDRKVRRFWLGFGAIVALVVLATVCGLGWMIWHAAANAGAGLLAIPLALLALAGIAVGGHKCVTVVQHWH